ncbi:MAG: elongation factor 4, partial [Chloroflexi bacterium]|nr:elongation factor 4 [Chloroflexota bacterium]
MEPRFIRNFCIIAHIDHGKSTLADRLLEITGAVSKRDMAEQFMDRMDLERERGITIKAKALRMYYDSPVKGQRYELNLIDTPGHVDFSYEVSRSLVACEGALLVVDASQGIQAQTLAHANLALEHNLILIPVVNKIDLPSAQPEQVAQELMDTFGFERKDILLASAKEGTGSREILEAVIERIPAPTGAVEGPLRALIIDSKYDSYKGVIAYVRIKDGHVKGTDRTRLMATIKTADTLEVGVFTPDLHPEPQLTSGQVGYIATGLKNVRDAKVGDTITLDVQPATEPLPGYRPLKPMVFAGLYPVESNDYGFLRDALEKHSLNDAGLSFEPESSAALGPGFRCGFLGLLHMEVVQERLEREYGLHILVTAPSVAYQVVKADSEEVMVDNPSLLPPPAEIAEVREPWLSMTLISPSRYIGTLMELMSQRRAGYKKMEYLQALTAGGQGATADGRVMLEYEMPLSEMLVGFYDEVKSRTQGYASIDYTFLGYRPERLVKLDILVNAAPVDALSLIVHQDRAYQQGRELVERLRKLIPRQLFDVPVQAAVGSKVIARETIKAKRKDVLAKCYGGDVTRKRKLLEKQKEGKKRMKPVGRVEIPQEAFLSILKT